MHALHRQYTDLQVTNSLQNLYLLDLCHQDRRILQNTKMNQRMYQMYRSLLLRIQLKKGIDKNWFQDKFLLNVNDVFGILFSELTALGCLEETNGVIRLTKYGAYFVEDVCDYIVDAALKEESTLLVRSPHSEGMTSSRLN